MPKNTTQRFLLVEDQKLLRELLRTHLIDEFAGCEVVEVATLAELLRIGDGERFDLSIVDLQLPDGNAMEWVTGWVEHESEPNVLVLSESDEDYVLFWALNSKVQGFVHKNDDRSTLLTGIKTVLNGGLFFSESVKKMRARMGSDPMFFNKVLSVREQEILKHLGAGLRNAEVAQMLSLTEQTVQDHRRRIMKKLGLHREAELIRYANRKGFSQI
jgi:DNA-binding NarL/FixJ family response regulator